MPSILPVLAGLGLAFATPAFAKPVAEVPSYEADVRPIFDTKCVSCHSCYDAPCQLNLTDPEGWRRGATTAAVYGELRFKDAPLTRLFEDASNPKAWRDKGFFPVIGDDAASSLLFAAVTQGATHALASNQPPPAEIDLSLGADQSCPEKGAYAEFAAEKPRYGMPYGMAPLSAEELNTLRAWIDAGAPVDTPPDHITATEQAEVQHWEQFLNQTGDRERLVARYLFEHWYIAKLSFEEASSAHDFQLVRSSTPSGVAIKRLPTRRPNEAPDASENPVFYYRFEKVEGTRVRKSHLPLVLSQPYLSFIDDLFLSGDWTTEPGTAANWDNGLNPFISFADIPQEARYNFLLEDAWYFISNFIRGPVCRGPIALNVIQDRFFVTFVHPAADLDEQFVYQSRNLLDLPETPANLNHYVRRTQQLARGQRRYLKRKDHELTRQIPEGRTQSDLWTDHPDARLTIFRHRDSSTVVRGWHGAETDTVWVMDYPTLERTYYSLVANFDVFGNVFHLTSTRLYFDFIRAESEDNFLLFLPPEERKRLRSSWYRGLVAKRKQLRQYRFAGRDLPTAVAYNTDQPKTEWLDRTGTFGPLQGVDVSSPLAARVADHLLAIEANPQPIVQHLPEMTVLHVVVDGTFENDLVYSLARNRAHTNISFMLRENQRLKPAEDTLTAMPGVLGDYPNRIFRFSADHAEPFFRQLQTVHTDEDYRALIQDFGLFRTDPTLFDEIDWLYRQDLAQHPIASGRLDLYRYGGELPDASWFKWPESVPLLGQRRDRDTDEISSNPSDEPLRLSPKERSPQHQSPAPNP